MAAVVTVSLVALVVGTGATFGQFGFRNGDTPVSVAPRVGQDTDTPGFFLADDGEGREHEGDREGGDRDGEHEREEHDDEGYGDD